MKLNYRAISYEYNPAAIETNNGTIGGKYRGLDWRFRNLKKPPVLQPRVSLTYRGVKYDRSRTDISVVAQPTPATPPLSTQDRARSLMLNQTRTRKKRQQAMLSRVAKEVGLAEIAAQY